MYSTWHIVHASELEITNTSKPQCIHEMYQHSCNMYINIKMHEPPLHAFCTQPGCGSHCGPWLQNIIYRLNQSHPIQSFFLCACVF